MGYGFAKNELFQKVSKYFESIREKRIALETDDDYIEDILKNGAKKVSVIADNVLNNVKSAIGL